MCLADCIHSQKLNVGVLVAVPTCTNGVHDCASELDIVRHRIFFSSFGTVAVYKSA